MSLLRTTVGICLLSSVLACGDPAPPPLEDVPGRYAEAFCDAGEECLGPLYEFFFPGDCATLLRKQLEEGALPLWEAGIASGNIVYRGGEVDGCIAEIESSGCGLFANAGLPACEAVFDGQVATGGACNGNEDCEDGYCAIGAMCPGTCVARGAAGAGCDEDEQCQAGLQCLGGECAVAPGEGEPCETDCAVPLQCDEGTCRSLASAFDGAVDDPCDPEASDLCDPGVFCALVGGGIAGLDWTCSAGAAFGGQCQLAFPEMCPAGQFCDADPESTGSFDGTCVDLPGEGEACRDSEFGAECSPNLVCVGTCERVQHVGDPCTDDELCFSGFCDAGTCAEPTCEG